MRPGHVLLVWLALCAAPSAAHAVDKDKLRELPKLPTVEVMAGVGFNTRTGLYLAGERRDIKAEIAALQKAMKGGAGDGPRYRQLGDLYAEAKEDEKAKTAYKKAVELHQGDVKAHPKDAFALAHLGQALASAGEDGEAEKTLRQAVKLGERDWRCWFALGCFLDDASMSLFRRPRSGKAGDAMTLMQCYLTNPPSKEEMEKTNKLAQEGRDCFGNAIALAPREPDPYVRRASSHCLRSFFGAMAGIAQGRSVNPLAAMYPAECLADLRKAADLSPSDVNVLGFTAWVEVAQVVFETKAKGCTDMSKVWKSFSPEKQKAVQLQLDRLEKVASSKDKRTAARACEVLGLLQFVAAGDAKRAREFLQKAVRLDPDRDGAWDLLAVTHLEAVDFKGLVTVGQQRVKHCNTARNQFMLAKAYECAKQFDKAEEAVKAALRLDANDFHANLALGALLLRRAKDEKTLAEAGKQIERATGLLGEKSPPNDRLCLSVTYSIYLALNGKEADARQLLEKVTRERKDHEQAKKALSLLETKPPRP
jgi:Flp pilus assembly protein TadD